MLKSLVKTQDDKFLDIEEKCKDLTLSQHVEATFQMQLKEAMFQESLKNRNVIFGQYYMKSILNTKTHLEKMHASLVNAKVSVHNQLSDVQKLVIKLEIDLNNYEQKRSDAEENLKSFEEDYRKKEV